MDKKNINKRLLTKTISFLSAFIIVLIGGCIYFYQQAKAYQISLENTYQHSLQDLNYYVNNISTYLNKSLYTNSPYQMSLISANLLSSSRAATTCLSSLPAAKLNLNNTFKFLSQIGSYSSSIAKKSYTDNNISDDDYNYLKQLNSYAKKLDQNISKLDESIILNNLKLGNKKINNNSYDGNTSDDSLKFQDLEKNFTGYPSLIYDGPFSDHILTKQPELTKKQSQISLHQAKQTAALATGTNEKLLKHSSDENSNMPLYCFSNDNISVGVTKNGGFICYIIKSRAVKDRKIDVGEAINNAKNYISQVLNIDNITHSYYDINNNICTINFAYEKDDIIFYPDLIKISVALDNGEIMSVDTRGYINNHKNRNISSAKKSAIQAADVLSKHLTLIKQPSLALIPTDGKNEILTYECFCRGENNENILVYINSDTLEEEKILMLIESPNGILTL